MAEGDQHRRGLARTGDRLWYGASTLVALGTLITARLLTPAANGVGTHEQLGLPPCTFYALTGHGCPGCGLTTAFAHLARGQLGAAWAANPVGLGLFAACALAVPFLAYRAARPVPVERYLESFWAVVALTALAVALFGTWLVRLVLGMV